MDPLRGHIRIDVSGIRHLVIKEVHRVLSVCSLVVVSDLLALGAVGMSKILAYSLRVRDAGSTRGTAHAVPGVHVGVSRGSVGDSVDDYIGARGSPHAP